MTYEKEIGNAFYVFCNEISQLLKKVLLHKFLFLEGLSY